MKNHTDLIIPISYLSGRKGFTESQKDANYEGYKSLFVFNTYIFMKATCRAIKYFDCLKTGLNFNLNLLKAQLQSLQSNYLEDRDIFLLN